MSYQYQSNPYTQGPSAESGYGHDQYEMQPYDQPPQTMGPQVLSSQAFLDRVKHIRNDIQSLTADVQVIASLHQRALSGTDGGSADAQLSNAVAATQLKNTSIRDQLRTLKADAERTVDASKGLKTRQFETLNKEFKGEIQRFIEEEKQYRERYREQIARQYRIVNPDATDDEVRQAADADWGNEGIFQTALRSNRSGQASAVLGAVRARHNELLKIEESITELAGLFQDLDTLIVMQEAAVVSAEEQTEQTNQHLQKGNEQVGDATRLAKHRRRLKWWCALVVLLIVIAIALGVGLGVYFSSKNAQGK